MYAIFGQKMFKMFKEIPYYQSNMDYLQSAYHHQHEIESHTGEVYSMQHYMIKFVSDLLQVGGFQRVLCFPTPVKLTATI